MFGSNQGRSNLLGNPFGLGESRLKRWFRVGVLYVVDESYGKSRNSTSQNSSFVFLFYVFFYPSVPPSDHQNARHESHSPSSSIFHIFGQHMYFLDLTEKMCRVVKFGYPHPLIFRHVRISVVVFVDAFSSEGCERGWNWWLSTEEKSEEDGNVNKLGGVGIKWDFLFFSTIIIVIINTTTTIRRRKSSHPPLFVAK